MNLPPLRERRQGLPALAFAWVGETVWASLPRQLRDQSADYSWPGNVREPRNALERAGHLSTAPGGIGADSILPQRVNEVRDPRDPPVQAPARVAATLQQGDLLPVNYSLDFKRAKDQKYLTLQSDLGYRYRVNAADNGGGTAASCDLIRVANVSLLPGLNQIYLWVLQAPQGKPLSPSSARLAVAPVTLHANGTRTPSKQAISLSGGDLVLLP